MVNVIRARIKRGLSCVISVRHDIRIKQRSTGNINGFKLESFRSCRIWCHDRNFSTYFIVHDCDHGRRRPVHHRFGRILNLCDLDGERLIAFPDQVGQHIDVQQRCRSRADDCHRTFVIVLCHVRLQRRPVNLIVNPSGSTISTITRADHVGNRGRARGFVINRESNLRVDQCQIGKNIFLWHRVIDRECHFFDKRINRGARRLGGDGCHRVACVIFSPRDSKCNVANLYVSIRQVVNNLIGCRTCPHCRNDGQSRQCRLRVSTIGSNRWINTHVHGFAERNRQLGGSRNIIFVDLGKRKRRINQ